MKSTRLGTFGLIAVLAVAVGLAFGPSAGGASAGERRQYLVRAESRAAAESLRRKWGEAVLYSHPEAKILLVRASAQEAKRLSNEQGVRSVEPDRAVRMSSSSHRRELGPQDPVTLSWFAERIGLEQAHQITRGSPDVKVAVLDTGLSFAHQAFDGNPSISAGHDLIDPENPPDDRTTHGTEVTGIIAARGSDTISVAPDVNIIPINVAIDLGFTTYSALIAGLLKAEELDADIALVAAGGLHRSKALRDAVRFVNSKGILVVAAAGNQAANHSLFPAAFGLSPEEACRIDGGLDRDEDEDDDAEEDEDHDDDGRDDHAENDDQDRDDNDEGKGRGSRGRGRGGDRGLAVLSVGASDPFDWPTWTSNLGFDTTVLAPGEDILTVTGERRGKILLSGNSASAAVAAGIAALVKSVDPSLGPRDLIRIVASATDPLALEDPDAIWSRLGRVNALKAVRMASKSRPDVAVVEIVPDPLRMTVRERSRVLVRVQNLSAEPANVTVSLRTGSEEIGRQHRVRVAGSFTAQVHFDFTPRQAGAHTLRAEAAFADDADPANNVRERTVDVASSPVHDVSIIRIDMDAPDGEDLPLDGNPRRPLRHSFFIHVRNNSTSAIRDVRGTATIGERQMATFRIPRLNPGQSRIKRVRIESPDSREGPEFVLQAEVSVSVDGNQQDAHPDNDRMQMRFLWAPDDLAVRFQYVDLPLEDVIFDAPHRLEEGREDVPFLVYFPDIHWDALLVRRFAVLNRPLTATEGAAIRAKPVLGISLGENSPNLKFDFRHKSQFRRSPFALGPVRLNESDAVDGTQDFFAPQDFSLGGAGEFAFLKGHGRHEIAQMPADNKVGSVGRHRVILFPLSDVAAGDGSCTLTGLFVTERFLMSFTNSVHRIRVSSFKVNCSPKLPRIQTGLEKANFGVWGYYDIHNHTDAEFVLAGLSKAEVLAVPHYNYAGPLVMEARGAFSIGVSNSGRLDDQVNRIFTTDHNLFLTDDQFPPVGLRTATGFGAGDEFLKIYRALFGETAGEETAIKKGIPPFKFKKVVGGIIDPFISDVRFEFDQGSHMLSYQTSSPIPGPWHGGFKVTSGRGTASAGGIHFPADGANDTDPAAYVDKLRGREGFTYIAHPYVPFSGSPGLSIHTDPDDIQLLLGFKRRDELKDAVNGRFIVKGLQIWNMREGLHTRFRIMNPDFMDPHFGTANPLSVFTENQGYKDEYFRGVVEYHKLVSQGLSYSFHQRPQQIFIRKTFIGAGSDAHGDFGYRTGGMPTAASAAVASEFLNVAAKQAAITADPSQALTQKGDTLTPAEIAEIVAQLNALSAQLSEDAASLPKELKTLFAELSKNLGNTPRSLLTDNAFAKARSYLELVDTDEQGGIPAEEADILKGAIEALKNGRLVLTDGPIGAFRLDSDLRYDSDGKGPGGIKHSFHGALLDYENDDGKIGGGGIYDGLRTMLITGEQPELQEDDVVVATPFTRPGVKYIIRSSQEFKAPTPAEVDALLVMDRVAGPGVLRGTTDTGVFFRRNRVRRLDRHDSDVNSQAPAYKQELLDFVDGPVIALEPFALTLFGFPAQVPQKKSERFEFQTNPIWVVPVRIDIELEGEGGVISFVDGPTNGGGNGHGNGNGTVRIPQGSMKVTLTFPVSMKNKPTAVFAKPLDAEFKSIDGTLAPFAPQQLSDGWRNSPTIESHIYVVRNCADIEFPLTPGQSPTGAMMAVYLVGLEGMTPEEAAVWGPCINRTIGANELQDFGIEDIHGNRLNSIARTFFAAQGTTVIIIIGDVAAVSQEGGDLVIVETNGTGSISLDVMEGQAEIVQVNWKTFRAKCRSERAVVRARCKNKDGREVFSEPRTIHGR